MAETVNYCRNFFLGPVSTLSSAMTPKEAALHALVAEFSTAGSEWAQTPIETVDGVYFTRRPFCIAREINPTPISGDAAVVAASGSAISENGKPLYKLLPCQMSVCKDPVLDTGKQDAMLDQLYKQVKNLDQSCAGTAKTCAQQKCMSLGYGFGPETRYPYR